MPDGTGKAGIKVSRKILEMSKVISEAIVCEGQSGLAPLTPLLAGLYVQSPDIGRVAHVGARPRLMRYTKRRRLGICR